ncbi:SMI1/KNR4 family protein [Streptomyces sp. NPDC086787]|uniref:SMI1/KNR4 family protein n=1 Tax=Streptomyces sp. NPDC086787 TaxID=3365759 RepID=UPI0037F268EB
MWPVELGREETRRGLQDSVDPLQLGILLAGLWPGPFLTARAIGRFRPGCRGIACFPAPLNGGPSGPDNEKTRLPAIAMLGQVWEWIGLEYYRDGVFALNLGTEILEERLKALGSRSGRTHPVVSPSPTQGACFPVTVIVDLPDHVRARCAELGAGVLYAVKTLARQLADDPRLGERAGRLGLYTATIDSDTFDACPPLIVRYAYGPPLLDVDRIEIRDIEATGPLPDAGDEQAPATAPDPRMQQITTRQVTEAWRRITRWLEKHAPASRAALLPGASTYEIVELEQALGVRVPVELRALWLLCAGGEDTPGAGVLPDYGWAVMPLGTVATSYRWHSGNQRETGVRWGDEDAVVWKPSWIPFCSWSVTDTSMGLFVDAETGKVGHWDDTSVRTVGGQTLSMLLEETADKLENPQLATGILPGLIGGRLVWGPPLAADEAALWEPFTG